MRRENFIENRGPRSAGAYDEDTFFDTHWITTNESAHDLLDISRLLQVINLKGKRMKVVETEKLF
jgi:hypothetical protein